MVHAAGRRARAGFRADYEPQWNSDVNSVQENVTSGEVYPREFLVENVPEERKADIDYVMSLMDWEKNIDPDYRRRYFRPPQPARAGEGDYSEHWIVYANPYIAAKELTIPPLASVMVKDAAAYGCILIQGHGRFGVWGAEAAGDAAFRPAFPGTSTS